MSFTHVTSGPSYSGPISIKPIVHPDSDNMGLQNYNMTLFPGTFQEEQLACLEKNGVKRYVTGLNEFAPEVKAIKDDEKRLAVIKEIRETVAQLEKELASNFIDPESEDFWTKVTLLRPDNDAFWSKITIRVGNEPVFLNPKTEPFDLIKLKAIEAGGFSIVSKSWEDAQNSARPPKFYLDKTIDTVASRTQTKKLRNKALSELDKLYNKNINKLMYVCKIVDAHSAQYRKSTPIDIMYENMDAFINGEGIERNELRAAETFLKAVEFDMETLKLKAVVKDASFYKVLAPRADGMIYHVPTGTMIGRNVSEIVEYLKNPLNENILIEILRTIEDMWNE
jgi:Tfp pilus assembly protein PilP